MSSPSSIGVLVQSLVEELRFHMPGPKNPKQNRNSVVTN